MSNKFWITVFGLIVLACFAAMLLMRGASGSTAKIYSGGELIETINFGTVQEPYKQTIHNKITGEVNTIEIKNGCIRVSESSCNDKICVRRGWISGSPGPIICLPNRLVIQIDDGSDIDGVVG